MPDTLQIDLVNTTGSAKVFAHVTGLATDQGGKWFLLRSDGHTPYYPENPPKVGAPVPDDVAIPLGGPGQTKSITIPHLAGGRIYFSIDKPITFLLNPGPALTEPSVTNPTDPNYATHWSFCEFTWNPDQIYANISYVDFVGIPLALTLHTQTGQTKSVLGLPKDGLQRIASALTTQANNDHADWTHLIVRSPKDNNQILRVLSPNQAQVLTPSLFPGYFDPYTKSVWDHYSKQPLQIDTQSAFGVVSGTVQHGALVVSSESFPMPSTHDIFNASAGPFATGADTKRNAIIPRINAELNRATLLDTDKIPAPSGDYYKNKICNHYARVVHETNIDGRGYAHPYDDVAPSGGKDSSGFVNDGKPAKLVVTIGGGQAGPKHGEL